MQIALKKVTESYKNLVKNSTKHLKILRFAVKILNVKIFRR